MWVIYHIAKLYGGISLLLLNYASFFSDKRYETKTIFQNEKRKINLPIVLKNRYV